MRADGVEDVRRTISWRAVFSGLAVGFATQIVLTLIGVAVGLSSLDLTGRSQNVGDVGVGAALWAGVTPIAAWFVGGLVTARCSGWMERSNGVMHGLVTWASGFVLTVSMLASGAGGLVSGTVGALGDVGAGMRLPLPSSEQVERSLREGASQITPRETQQAARTAGGVVWAAVGSVLFTAGAACAGGAVGSGDRRGRRRERHEAPRGPIITTPRPV